MEFLFIENFKCINMSAEIIRIGRYQMEIERGKSVAINNSKGVIYTGKWYDTLNDFFDKITPLPDHKKEYELQLAFDLPTI